MPSLPVTDYATALDFLLGRINYERTANMPYRSRSFKLERMKRLLARVGEPQKRLPAIHIAGTKGKGSTAAMVQSILTAAGYRTGLYTSPHLERMEERLVVDGVPCDEATLVRLAAQLQPLVDEFDVTPDSQGGTLSPTYFEIVTVMALLYFAEVNADFAVLEVGLGGRLDSTNICHPRVSAITSISFDHTAQLGNTLAAIAGEKAGIIKPGIPVISGVLPDEPRTTIAAVAARERSPLIQLGVDFGFENSVTNSTARSFGGSQFDYWSRRAGITEERAQVPLALCGRHQAANGAVALAIVDELIRQGTRIDEEAIRHGMATTRCAARVELMNRQPDIVVDVAHNAASVAALGEVLDDLATPVAQRTLIFGTSRDKDAHAMLEVLLPRFARVIFTKYQNNPRGVEPEELLAMSQAIFASNSFTPPQCETCRSPAEVVNLLRGRLSPDAFVCSTGSFFLAAEMRPLVGELAQNLLGTQTLRA